MSSLNLRKHGAFLVIGTTTAALAITIGMLLSKNNFQANVNANYDPFSLTLNASNAPTESTSFTNVEHHNAIANNDYTAFSYTNVKALDAGHCVLAQSGVIVKDEASHHIEGFTVAINDGKLQIETGFEAGVLNTTYILDSTGVLNACGNYFRITALEQTELVSMTISYACLEGESAEGHEFGELIPAASGVPAHYECAHCGVAFNENKDAQIDATLYQIKFFDGDNLIQTNSLGINSPVTGPSGTYRTFYNILGYNAKVGDAWDDTLLADLPNVTGNADYRIVKEVKADKDYLLNDNPDNVLSSSWDTGGNLSKSNVADVPEGATMSSKTTSVLIGTQNGVTTLKIGSDFFYAVKNNAFDDTDYVQVYAKFPVIASGSKYNNIGLHICKAQSYGMAQGQPTDNSGATVYYNGGKYCLKQLMANGGWQQFRIYVSELKTMLAGVPETNTTEWDAIAFIHPYGAASPESAKAREMKVYDVEFHRIDITQDFIINDCVNMAQVRSCTNTYFAASNNGVNELYDTTVPYNYSGTDYPSGKPTTSLKTDNMAINAITNSGGWESQVAMDISFIINNINAFDDTDKVVTYIWGFNNYGSWVGLGGLNESYVNGGGVNMTSQTAYAKKVCNDAHRQWVEATITIAELKALTVMSAANPGGNVASYTHDAINKSVWLQWHNKAGGAGTPNLVYSVELHHAS